MKRMEMKAIRPCAAISACLLSFIMGSSAQASLITLGNSAHSGVIAGVDGTDQHTMSFNNNANFLAVAVNAGAVSLSGTVAAPAVTFGGDSLTLLRMEQRTQNGWTGIYYLANPQQGAFDLEVNFGANIIPVGTGGFIFGALSLQNVDLANPIAGQAGGNINDGSAGYTITNATPGAITAGDYLLSVVTADNIVTHPHLWISPTTNATQFYAERLTADTTRRADTIYWSLTSADITGAGNDEVTLVVNGSNRTKVVSGVVFNAIPEPGTMTLLALAGMVTALLRRSRMT